MCLFPLDLKVQRKGEDFVRKVTVGCGHCSECLKKKALEWSVRICDEAKCWQRNCFITLTYNNEHLPEYGSLKKSDFQKFMKRLRERLEPLKVRFFACGEYGKKRTRRPHYHAVIFNWMPEDMIYFKTEDGIPLYRSAFLEKVWPFGFSSVGYVTQKSALYCAKYMQKLNVSPNENCEQPFLLMSNRPGIGYYSINEKCLLTDSVYQNGVRVNVPRYYLKVLEREKGIDLKSFIDRRCQVGKIKERNAEELYQAQKNFWENFGNYY